MIVGCSSAGQALGANPALAPLLSAPICPGVEAADAAGPRRRPAAARRRRRRCRRPRDRRRRASEQARAQAVGAGGDGPVRVLGASRSCSTSGRRSAGPSPLAAKQYRIQADFDEATQLADDRRRAHLGRDRRPRAQDACCTATARARRSRSSPSTRRSPSDTRAILRLKTLLGETYVELTPGNEVVGRAARQRACWPAARWRRPSSSTRCCARSTPTRARRCSSSSRGWRSAVDDRGADLNAALGNLQPVAGQTNDLLTVLDSQRGAVRRLVADTRHGVRRARAAAGRAARADHRRRPRARVDRAPQRRPGRDRADPADDAARAAARRWPTSSCLVGDATPVVRDLRPAARALGPTLTDAVALAPELEGLFRDVDRRDRRVATPRCRRRREFVDAARAGLPRCSRRRWPRLKPVVDFLGPHKREFVTMWANIAADTQAIAGRGERRAAALHPRARADHRRGARRQRPALRHEPPQPVLRARRAGASWSGTGSRRSTARTVNNQSPPGQFAPPCKLQPPQEFQGRTPGVPARALRALTAPYPG